MKMSKQWILQESVISIFVASRLSLVKEKKTQEKIFMMPVRKVNCDNYQITQNRTIIKQYDIFKNKKEMILGEIISIWKIMWSVARR